MLEEVRGGLMRQQSSWAPGDLAQASVLEAQRISELATLLPHIERINQWDVVRSPRNPNPDPDPNPNPNLNPNPNPRPKA